MAVSSLFSNECDGVQWILSDISLPERAVIGVGGAMLLITSPNPYDNELRLPGSGAAWMNFGSAVG